MRKSATIIGFLMLTCLLAAAPATGQDDSIDPDAWEARHNAYQPPDKVMAAMGVKSGMIIAEVGAGRGRYAVRVAAKVGAKGKVFANDIDVEKLEYLKLRCKRDGIHNIEIILGEVTDPKLPAGRMDIVYLINTYHHLDEPVKLLKHIRPALKPEGRLVIIEHDAEKMPDASPRHVTSRENLLADTEAAGYKLVRIDTFLERDNINIFRLANPTGLNDKKK